MSVRMEVLADRGAIVARAVEIAQELSQEAIAARGRFAVVLAGGSTPKPVYETLATLNLPWDKWHVFWGDERYVPPTDSQSNAGMARAAWLDRVPIPAANIHPIPTDEADPVVAAARYEQTLRAWDGPLDLVWLGMGDDGHTASLFPHTAALAETQKWVTVGYKGEEPRITLTYPVLLAARQVVFLVEGAKKAPALQAVLGEGDPDTYPARRFRDHALWLCDRQAAG
ncbi:MAG: 6-phosphogluconolactonase [Pseudanabaenaceae cyanobacterium]